MVNLGVGYIPTQTPDEAAFTSSRAALQSPWVMLASDAYVLFSNLKYAPQVMLPMRKPAPLPGIPENKALAVRDTVLNGSAALMELLFLVASVIPILILPGWGEVLYGYLAYLSMYVLVRPMWGGLILHSQVKLADPKVKEKWFFINGIATSHDSLQQTCDRVAETFKRPVTGVHNRSFGMVFDVIECMIQRCFNYTTMDVRCAYEVLKIAVLDPNVEKVVAMAHSQGGIIISLVMDRMFAELPASALSKMEIYTFGSAASHFNNPQTYSALSTLANSKTNPSYDNHRPRTTNVLSTIEHYANEFDMVPRWGVLHSTRTLPLQRYAGRVFVNVGASGHLFNEHYLDVMFPLPTTATMASDPDPTSAPASPSGTDIPSTLVTLEPKALPSAEAYPDGTRPIGRPGLSQFLDRVVDVDEATAISRAQAVEDTRDKGFVVSPAGGEARAGAKMGPNTGRRPSVQDETQAALGEGAGRTVRQLSKLWMYVGGESPRGREPSVDG